MNRSEDQQKVRRAIARQCVDPADVPATAKAAPPAVVSGMPPAALAGQKRKFDSAVTFQSVGQSSIPNANAEKGARSSPGDEDEEVGLIEPESADELYCVMKSSIVGVQYYKGTCFGASSQVSLCLPGVQVSLGPENKSAWSGSRTTNMTGKT